MDVLEKSRVFKQILLNNLVVSIVNSTVWFAVTFYVILETKSVLAVGILSGIYLILNMFSAFPFGTFIDQNLKKKVFQISSLLSGFFFFIAFLIYIIFPKSSWQNVENIWLWGFCLVMILGIVATNLRSIALPTVTSILIEKDKLDKANGLVGMVSGVSFLVTSVISALLVSRSGMYHVLLIAFLINFISVIHLYFLKIDETLSKESKVKNTFKENLSLVFKYKAILPMIIFSSINNLLGGVYMALMDAYGLTLVDVKTWGLLWAGVSTAFILGGIMVSKFGLGKRPVYLMTLLNIAIWVVSIIFPIQNSIWLLIICMFIYMGLIPFVEASEQTILQKIVPTENQGRVFGFAQTIESAASPVTAFLIGPLTQIFFIPFMTDGWGAKNIGSWFGVGYGRGLALVFVITGLIGLVVTLLALKSKYFKMIEKEYVKNI